MFHVWLFKASKARAQNLVKTVTRYHTKTLIFTLARSTRTVTYLHFGSAWVERDDAAVWPSAIVVIVVVAEPACALRGRFRLSRPQLLRAHFCWQIIPVAGDEEGDCVAFHGARFCEVRIKNNNTSQSVSYFRKSVLFFQCAALAFVIFTVFSAVGGWASTPVVVSIDWASSSILARLSKNKLLVPLKKYNYHTGWFKWQQQLADWERQTFYKHYIEKRNYFGMKLKSKLTTKLLLKKSRERISSWKLNKGSLCRYESKIENQISVWNDTTITVSK